MDDSLNLTDDEIYVIWACLLAAHDENHTAIDTLTPKQEKVLTKLTDRFLKMVDKENDYDEF